MGFDNIEVGSVHSLAANFASLIRRDALVPLRVRLPGVTAGNVLVVDASGLTTHVPNGGTTAQLLLPVVSFDGSTVYAPGGSFFWISNAIQESTPADGTGLALPTGFRCYAAVRIPNGATVATVELAYTATSGFFVAGQGTDFTNKFPSITLSATELLASAVPQVGTSSLVAY